jgi:hypothetical protein
MLIHLSQVSSKPKDLIGPVAYAILIDDSKVLMFVEYLLEILIWFWVENPQSFKECDGKQVVVEGFYNTGAKWHLQHRNGVLVAKRLESWVGLWSMQGNASNNMLLSNEG